MQEDFLALLRADTVLAALLEVEPIESRPLIDWVIRPNTKFEPLDSVYPSFTHGNTQFKQVIYDNHRDMPVQDLPGGKRVFHLEADYIVWHREQDT